MRRVEFWGARSGVAMLVPETYPVDKMRRAFPENLNLLREWGRNDYVLCSITIFDDAAVGEMNIETALLDGCPFDDKRIIEHKGRPVLVFTADSEKCIARGFNFYIGSEQYDFAFSAFPENEAALMADMKTIMDSLVIHQSPHPGCTG